MSQIAYNLEPGQLKAGMLSDLTRPTKKSYKNTTGASVPFGVMVALGAADDRLKRLTGLTDRLVGITIHDHASSNQGTTGQVSDPPFGSATQVDYQIPDKRVAQVLREGACVVDVEGAVVTESAPFVRVTANGAGKDVIGSFRGDSDGGTCIRVTGVKFLSSTAAAGQALVFVSGDIGWVPNDGPVASGSAPGFVQATVGAEAANAIDVVCAIVDANGAPITAARAVSITSVPVTADQGDIAAAGAPVGTALALSNPATGDNNASMLSTAAGLFSFRITNTAAETNVVIINADGCPPRVLRLIFA